MNWQSLPPLLERRDELAVVVGPDRCVYALGGFGGNRNATLRTVERFDVHTQDWQPIAPMKEPRRALSAVALPDGIYVIGGYNGAAQGVKGKTQTQQYLSSVEKYDFATRRWSSVAKLNEPRCSLAAVASQDCQYIYAIGGFNGAPTDTVERYDVISNTWEVVTSMIHMRFMHTATIIS